MRREERVGTETGRLKVRSFIRFFLCVAFVFDT